MKKIKFLIPVIIAVLSFAACNQCEEVVMEPCGPTLVNSEFCGWSVATCYTEDPGGDVGSILDTRFNSQAPVGGDWGTHTSPVSMIHPSNWTAGQIGQVFGTAIDADQNIYLASSDIYFYDGLGGALPSGNPGRPFSAGQIFKCAPPTFTAVPFAVLPNTGDPLNGTGNVAYDKWNDQLFATNMEDGKIYRIATSTGSIIETYDPWAADTGTPGITIQDERVWSVGVNNEGGDVKVYFPRVSNMNANREIFSVTLINGAFPVAGSEVIEMANVRGKQPIISDLAFSSNGQEMLIAERGHPHEALTMSFSKLGASWNLNTQYFVGGLAVPGIDGGNSAGGVDFAYTEQNGDVSTACDEFFWATGNYMSATNSTLGRIYGMQGIAYSGNNPESAISPTANKDTDLFIDYDGIGSTGVKRTIGDVEVFDCIECVDPCTLNKYPN